MGQISTASAGCHLSSIHLCEQESLNGSSSSMPSRCGGGMGLNGSGASAGSNDRCCGAGTIQAAGAGRLTASYTLDLTGGRRLGSGTFSSVFCASHQSSQELRIVRVLPRRLCDRERMWREVDVLRHIDHPNLSRLLEVYEDPLMISLIMEIAPGRHLLLAVSSMDDAFTERCISGLMRQLLLGLNHLHTVGVAHEDVQPKNILVTDRTPYQDSRLKLIDYGFAAKFSKGGPSFGLRCSPCMAPEQVGSGGRRMGKSQLGSPDHACDMWAVGALAFVLLSGRWAFEATSAVPLYKAIRAGVWSFVPEGAWSSVTHSATSFVSQLLRVQPSDRATAPQVLEHQFLAIGGLELDALPSPPRGEEVIGALRRLSALDLIHDVTVEALAAHLTPPRLNRALPSSEAAPLGDVRRCLVQAGVPLPGSMRPAVMMLEASVAPAELNAKEILAMAAERRRGLEEVSLWSTWMQHSERASSNRTVTVSAKPSSAVPPPFLDASIQAEVAEVLERGGDSLLDSFGIPPGRGPSLEAIATLSPAPDGDAGAGAGRADHRRAAASMDAGRFAALLSLLRATAEHVSRECSPWPLRLRGQPMHTIPQLQLRIPPPAEGASSRQENADRHDEA